MIDSIYYALLHIAQTCFAFIFWTAAVWLALKLCTNLTGRFERRGFAVICLTAYVCAFGISIIRIWFW